ncbi:MULTISPECIES: hypothetical protein [Paenibacillus]|uniref:hypothetical protein n=1 Tax=Paenibacillus TaxID=44249 RepID=UPI0015C40A1D|nr:hypothetical protein [Paenibacillus odorifer]
MLRYEKVDHGIQVNYMLHINHNYRLYIDIIDGEARYGVWSEIGEMNIPILSCWGWKV